MRVRKGFTVIELIVVMTIGTIVVSMVVPSIRKSMSQTRVQRAASVIAADLQLAHSLAGRQRRPITIDVDTVARIMIVRDYSTPTTVYSTRYFSNQGEHPVQRLGVNRTSTIVYPNGRASGSLTLSLVSQSGRRTVRMTRAGQIRVSAP